MRKIAEQRRMVDPLDVIENIRWEILMANRAGENLWDRLSHLGEALDLVAALEEAVEQAIRHTAHELRTWGGGAGEPKLEGV